VNDLESSHPQNERFDQVFTESELAEHLQVTPLVLAQMRRRGEGPPFVMCGKFARYPHAGVKRWLADAQRAQEILGRSISGEDLTTE
jgi:hypothetical protein